MWASDGLNALRRSGEDELLMSVLLGLSVRSQKAGEYHGQPNVRCAERTFGTVQSALYRPVVSYSLWMPNFWGVLFGCSFRSLRRY